MAQGEVISSQLGVVLHQTKDVPNTGTLVDPGTIGVSSTLSSLENKSDQLNTEPTAVDPAALKSRYDQERDKRLAANPEGVSQYRSIQDGDPHFGHYLHDPYVETKIERDVINEEVEVLIVGGGYGGQLVAVRLLEKGINSIRIVEKGGDFGGTW